MPRDVSLEICAVLSSSLASPVSAPLDVTLLNEGLRCQIIDVSDDGASDMLIVARSLHAECWAITVCRNLQKSDSVPSNQLDVGRNRETCQLTLWRLSVQAGVIRWRGSQPFAAACSCRWMLLASHKFPGTASSRRSTSTQAGCPLISLHS